MIIISFKPLAALRTLIWIWFLLNVLFRGHAARKRREAKIRLDAIRRARADLARRKGLSAIERELRRPLKAPLRWRIGRLLKRDW